MVFYSLVHGYVSFEFMHKYDSKLGVGSIVVQPLYGQIQFVIKKKLLSRIWFQSEWNPDPMLKTLTNARHNKEPGIADCNWILKQCLVAVIGVQCNEVYC